MQLIMKQTIIGEILVAVVVLLGLGLITFNQFRLAEAKSRDIGRKNDLHEVSKVIRLYYKDYKKLPDESLINSLWGKEWVDDGYVYMKNVPEEKWGQNQFCYRIVEDDKSFALFADLENKKDVDCKNESFECGGEKYCCRDVLAAEVIK